MRRRQKKRLVQNHLISSHNWAAYFCLLFFCCSTLLLFRCWPVETLIFHVYHINQYNALCFHLKTTTAKILNALEFVAFFVLHVYIYIYKWLTSAYMTALSQHCSRFLYSGECTQESSGYSH